MITLVVKHAVSTFELSPRPMVNLKVFAYDIALFGCKSLKIYSVGIIFLSNDTHYHLVLPMKDSFPFFGVSDMELVDMYLIFIDVYVRITTLKLKEFLDVRFDIIDI